MNNDPLNLPIGCKVQISIIRPSRVTPDITVDLDEEKSRQVIELLKSFPNDTRKEYVYLIDYKIVDFFTSPDLARKKYPLAVSIHQVGLKEQLLGYYINVYPDDLNYTVTPNSKSDEVSIPIS